MTSEHQANAFEERIRRLSYRIWEREGHQEGHSQEHWLRAKAELENRIYRFCQAPSVTKDMAGFVPPCLPISQPPTRH